MTEGFDRYCKKIITEYLTASAKRKESRYWNNTAYPDATIRKVRSNTSMKDSQKTKILNQQQYVGDFWDDAGVRGRNKSEKNPNLAGIAKGLGGRLRINRKPGSAVNSKQGNMEVKYTLGNGVSKIGRANRTDFQNISKPFSKDS